MIKFALVLFVAFAAHLTIATYAPALLRTAFVGLGFAFSWAVLSSIAAGIFTSRMVKLGGGGK